MRHRSRLLVGALLSTIGLLGATLTPASAFGQTVGASVVDSETRVLVEGTILVLAGVDGVDTAVTAAPLDDEVRLVTPAGDSVVLTGSLTENVSTGSTFTGTVAVPTHALEQVNEVVEHALGQAAPALAANTVTAESPVGSEILSASARLDTSLAVVAATITTEASEVGQTQTAHTLDVAVVTLPSAPSEGVMSDTAIDTMTTTLSSYWASQSAGQAASVSRPAPVRRFVSGNACSPTAIWDEAAALFGHDSDWYWAAHSPAEHLVVIAPKACGAGSGLGSVGSSVDAGGLVWVGYFNVLATSTVAHELGHNLGLQHSNASECPDNTAEGATCADKEYEDFYDIMGGGLYYQDQSGVARSNTQLMALNVTQRSRLRALSDTDLPPVTLAAGVSSSQTGFALQPASATSGLRGLEITDPRTGQVYFVEYRSGTGMDSGSLYASGLDSKLGVGVRVLQLRNDGTSAVLTRPNAQDQNLRALFMTATQSFTSASGGLRVTVTGTGSTAAVTVNLLAPLSVLAPPPVPTVSGTTTVGSTLTANPGTWGPGTVALAYQWFRSGVAIAGATSTAYKPVAADLGQTIKVRVTGSRPGYRSASTYSASTTAVANGTLATSTPTISGTTKVGYTLTANPGAWGPVPVTLTYRWYRSGAAISGATAQAYRLVAADRGKAMSLRVVAAKGGYTSTSKFSAATSAVATGTLVPRTPTITGTKRVGYTLTANPGSWGPGGVTLTYRWSRSGVPIAGSNGKTYKLVSADRYDRITVRVTGVKAGYASAARYSASTTKVG